MSALLCDPFGAVDIFCDGGLHSVRHVGGTCYRFTLASSNCEEAVTAAKIIMPLELIVPAIYLTARTIGWQFLEVGPGRRELRLH